MSAQCETTGRRAGGAKMPFFERYLSLWVALCIVAGILLGRFLPSVFESLGAMEMANVNLPVAVLIWLMILPMLLKIDFHSLVEVRQHWKGVGVTLFINWGVKPFSMALLAWLFIRNLFSGWLTAPDPGTRQDSRFMTGQQGNCWPCIPVTVEGWLSRRVLS